MVEGCAPQRLQPMETHCCYVCHLLPPSLVVACVSTPTQQGEGWQACSL